MRLSAILGTRGEGKTTAAVSLGLRASSAGLMTAGIVAPVVYNEGVRIGYDVVDLCSGERAPWLRLAEGVPTVGPFIVVHGGETVARGALERMLSGESDLAILDEVGEWELAGGGHSWAVDRLADCPAASIVLVMREGVVTRVKQRWGFSFRCWRPCEVQSLASALGLGGEACR
ncbi:hypothetical protein JXA88_16265 [Candidatus Fermentibacteria bacterium]|nr:hypothetical protein [Candidatus Fermentibacteria bacterium]